MSFWRKKKRPVVLEIVDGKWVDIVGEVDTEPNTTPTKESEQA